VLVQRRRVTIPHPLVALQPNMGQNWWQFYVKSISLKTSHVSSVIGNIRLLWQIFYHSHFISL